MGLPCILSLITVRLFGLQIPENRAKLTERLGKNHARYVGGSVMWQIDQPLYVVVAEITGMRSEPKAYLTDVRLITILAPLICWVCVIPKFCPN